jgi:hypothetical protein
MLGCAAAVWFGWGVWSGLSPFDAGALGRKGNEDPAEAVVVDMSVMLFVVVMTLVLVGSGAQSQDYDRRVLTVCAVCFAVDTQRLRMMRRKAVVRKESLFSLAALAFCAMLACESEKVLAGRPQTLARAGSRDPLRPLSISSSR